MSEVVGVNPSLKFPGENVIKDPPSEYAPDRALEWAKEFVDSSEKSSKCYH